MTVKKDVWLKIVALLDILNNLGIDSVWYEDEDSIHITGFLHRLGISSEYINPHEEDI